MKKSFTRKIIAASAVFTLTAMISGCEDSSAVPPQSPEGTLGKVTFIGGTPVPENEKVDLEVSSVGTGYLLGFVGHLREDGSHSTVGADTTCEIEPEDNVTLTGSSDVYGIKVGVDGQIAFHFDPVDGFFHSDTDQPCVYARNRAGSVEFLENPATNITARLIANPELCNTFCDARATATCEGEASSCLEETRRACMSTCDQPGTLIVSSQAASVNWQQPEPETEIEPEIPQPSRPGDPILPGPHPVTPSSQRGQFDLVLDQLYVPTEVTIGFNNCLTVVGTRIYTQPCDPGLPQQKFVVETIGRYEDQVFRQSYPEIPNSIAGNPVWISGKPQQRIRQGTRCLVPTSYRDYFNTSPISLEMRDCATSTSEEQRFFFGRTEENRFYLLTAPPFPGSSSGLTWVGWLSNDRIDGRRIWLSMNTYSTELTREYFDGMAPGTIRVAPPAPTDSVDATRISVANIVRALKAGENVTVQLLGPRRSSNSSLRIFSYSSASADLEPPVASYSTSFGCGYNDDLCSNSTHYYDWSIRLVEEKTDGSVVVEVSSPEYALCIQSSPSPLTLAACGTESSRLNVTPIESESFRFRIINDDGRCLTRTNSGSSSHNFETCSSNPIAWESADTWTFLRSE